MNLRKAFISAMLIGFVGFGMPADAYAQGTPSAAALPADSWPRDISLSNAALLVYQPQVGKWEGNRIDFRAAVAIKPNHCWGRCRTGST